MPPASANQFDKNSEKALSNLNRTIKLVAEFGTIDCKDVEKFSKIAEEILSTAEKYENHQRALRLASEKPFEEFDQTYKRELVTETPDIRQSNKFKKFVTDMTELFEKSNAPTSSGSTATTSTRVDDDMSIQNSVSNIDPITKRPIQTAVRNKKCNHVYDKDSIAESLRFNSRLRCPIMGCANKQFVVMSDLTEDKELQRVFDNIRMEDSDED
jgi:E3 SUMO-protein ligase NSE2